MVWWFKMLQNNQHSSSLQVAGHQNFPRISSHDHWLLTRREAHPLVPPAPTLEETTAPTNSSQLSASWRTVPKLLHLHSCNEVAEINACRVPWDTWIYQISIYMQYYAMVSGLSAIDTVYSTGSFCLAVSELSVALRRASVASVEVLTRSLLRVIGWDMMWPQNSINLIGDNNVLLVKIEGSVWYTIYHHLPVAKGVCSKPSIFINQPMGIWDINDWWSANPKLNTNVT